VARRAKIRIGVVVVLVLGFVAFRLWTSVSISRMESRIRDQGYPVTLQELDAFYPTPDPSENRAPLLQYAFASIVEPGLQLEKKLPIAGKVNLPRRSERIPEEQVRAMRSYCLQNLDAITAVFESFEYKECRFPIDLALGADTWLDHIGPMHSLARMLAIRGILTTLNGDTQLAANQITGVFKLADSIEKEPAYVSQMARTYMHDHGLNALEQAINRASFSGSQLARIQEQLIEAEESRGFLKGLFGMRCVLTDADYMLNTGISNGFLHELDPGLLWLDLVYSPSGWLDLNRKRTHETMEQIIAASELPVEEQLDASQTIIGRFESDTVLNSGSGITMTEVAQSLAEVVRIRARLRVAIVALAVARYEADKGVYPDRTDALVPDYLENLPIDPCGGGPMRYRQLDGGYVVYSVGRNGVDDGGEELEHFPDWERGDLTFTVERTNYIHHGDTESTEN